MGLKDCRYLSECKKGQEELKCPEYWIDCDIYREKVKKEIFENDPRVKSVYIKRPDRDKFFK